MFKRSKITFLMVITCILLAGLFIYHPSFATESKNVTETVFFGNVEDDGSACGVFTVLNLVVDILSIGIGILGVIGITVVGIKYLTAKDNEEQTRKAKHRMLQIVIGLATAALLYTGLQFLLPGGKLSFTTECKTMSDQDLQKIKDKEKAEQEKAAANSGSSSKPSSGSSSGSSSTTSNENYKNSKAYKDCLKNAAKVVKKANICEYDTAAKRIVATAKLLAWPKNTKHNYKYPSGSPRVEFKSAKKEVFGSASWDTQNGASCIIFNNVVVRASGVDKNFPRGNDQFGYKSKKFERIECKKCSIYKKTKPGDIIMYYTSNGSTKEHVLIRGNGVVYEAQYHGKTYGHASPLDRIMKNRRTVILRPKD